MNDHLKLVTQVGGSPSAPVPSSEDPFRLLVLADFTGRAERGSPEPLARRKPRRVDRDDLPAVFSDLAPELEIPSRVEGTALRLRPESLEDLHPDSLWEALDVFDELRSLRGRLSKPETFAAAALELGVSVSTPAPAQRPATSGAQNRELPGDLLEAAVQATDGSRRAGTGSELVDALLDELVIPRIPATPGQADLLAGLDAAAAEQMRRVLGARPVRRTEAAWRSVELLVRRLETDAQLQVWILDVSAQELLADALQNEDVGTSGLWRAAFEPDAAEPDTPRFAAWIALDLAFGATPGQAALLARLARLAAAASTPLLASACEDLAGCPSLAEAPDPGDWGVPAQEAALAWDTLRGLPSADWVLLALPRLLLRAPYGAKTAPVERFAFEELSSPPAHEEFLWGSGALAAGLALGAGFTSRGWRLELAREFELERLPTPAYTTAEGELDVKPPGEVVLSDRAAGLLRERGLVPLCTVRDTDRMRLGPLTALSGKSLAGRWPR